MNQTYVKLLSPGKIGSLELKNRSVFPPMGTNYCNEGVVNDRLIHYHAARAKGGCGLNIVEICPVHYTSQTGLNPNIYSDDVIPAFAKLAKAIHDNGGKACLQLWHGGRQTSGKPFNGKPWAPSATTCGFIGEEAHAMTIDEVWEVIHAYGDAALRAKKAGFDCVELHGAHGYLIDSFVNRHTNLRTDEFGGSLENRTRFGSEIIKDIKKKCGDDFPVMIRLSADEHSACEGSLKIEESIEAAKFYKRAGVDALDISQGSYETISYTVPPYFFPHKVNVENAGRFRREVGLPVIVAGRINTPDMAEEVLEEGMADFISFGRVQMTDPEFMNKVMNDRVDDIVHCVSCNQGCVERLFLTSFGASCVFNPACGYEESVVIKEAEEKKKVLVVGAGPAGLEAARVAAMRGHDVTLMEKTGKVGGQYLLAAVAPHKRMLADSMSQMGIRAAKAGVDVRLFTEANEARIKNLNPDFIILATGGEFAYAPIKGAKNSINAWEFLETEDFVACDKVAIIGGGLTAMEVMEILAKEGRKVTMIEMEGQIAKDMEFYVRPYFDKIIQDYNVEVLTNTKCIEIADDYIRVEKDGKEEKLDFTCVVMATGVKAYNPLEDLVKELGIPYKVIGDAAQPGKVMAALWAGNEIAREI